jgi:hypothetical protein
VAHDVWVGVVRPGRAGLNWAGLLWATLLWSGQVVVGRDDAHLNKVGGRRGGGHGQGGRL